MGKPLVRSLPAVPTWARRPALPAVLLAAAVAVSVAVGQPAPADRASGLSVPLSTTVEAPADLGTLLLVSTGRLTRHNLRTGTTEPVRLPAGQLAVRVWAMRGADVVLTRPAPARPITDTPSPPEAVPPRPVPLTPGGLTQHGPGGAGPQYGGGGLAPSPGWAYAVPHRGDPVRLGPATEVVPSLDGGGVWLSHGGVARLVNLDGSAVPARVSVPFGYRLVGAARPGLVATVGGVDPHTVVLPVDGAPPRWLADAEALDVVDGVLLVHDQHRVGWVSLSTGARHWLPRLSAVEVTGPGTLAPGAESFAVRARVNQHARLVVGQVDAGSVGQLRVVALEGGDASDHPTAPVWTRDGSVLAIRPDQRMVVYRPGDARASVLGARYTASGVAAVGPAGHDLPH